MNSKSKKILAAILCCTVVLGGAGATVFATSGKEPEVAEEALALATEEAPALATEEGDAALVKDETVYVLTGADGNVEKVIVSDWINASGNDIYSQENSEKELPVSLSVSYTLDGKSISPSDLAGKSGKVTIRFDYENHQFETVEIDGKQEKIYVPFTMLTGMLLDNNKFTNVSVSNGRLINDGDHTIVAGLAFPGLKSNLNVDKEKLELPDYVEVSADVENFEMLGTFTVATNEVFRSLDSEKLNSVDELSSSLDELTVAMDQLMDGSSALYDGLSTLLDKSGELAGGINQLADGTAQLSTGAGTLDDGAASLSDGAGSLANGLGQLTANNAALTAGSRQIFDSLLNMANAQLGEGGLSVPTLTIDNYGEVLNGVIASLDSESGAASVSALKAQLDSYNTFYTGLKEYTAGVSSAKDGADALNAGAGQLKEGTAALKTGMNELYTGVLKLKDGAPALIDGVTKLRDGAMQLSNGLKEFNDRGVQKLVDAVDGDLGSLFTRLKATVDVSKNYKSFSGISEETNGQVKFIYRTDSVKEK